MFKVSVNFTPIMVIEKVMRGKDCTGWAITEAFERGDGVWDKVRDDLPV